MKFKRGDLVYIAIKHAKHYADRVPGVLGEAGAPLIIAGSDPGGNVIVVLPDGGLFLDGSRRLVVSKSVLVPNPPSAARAALAEDL